MSELSLESKQQLGSVYLSEALALFNGGQTQRALDALGKATNLEIPIKNCHLVRAVCLAATGLSFLALEAAEAEIDAFPEDGAARAYLKGLQENMRQAAGLEWTSGVPPLFSVVVAIDDTWRGSLRSVRSLLVQQYQHIEVIVVQCRDEPEVAREFSQLDSRIKVVCREGASVPEAIEFGLREANGEYQLVVEHPSTVFSDTGLRVIAEVFARVSHVSFVSAERVYFDSNGFAQPMRFNTQRWSRQLLLDEQNFTSPTLTMSFGHVVWSADLFRKVGGTLNGMLREAYDYELFVRFLRHAQPFTVTVPLMIGEVPLDGYSRALSTRYIAEALTVLKREKKASPLSARDNEAPPLVKIQGKRHRLLSECKPIVPIPRPREELSRILRDRGPRISIVTPSYNQAEYLEETIDSILSQGYPHLQYSIVDGGSTDGSLEIIKKYSRYLHYWRSSPDAGQYYAIQEGFQYSSGDVMTWLNSDDRLKEHALTYAGAVFMQLPHIRWLTGRHSALLDNGEESQLAVTQSWSREQYLREGFDRPFIQQEGTFWRRSLWEEAGASLDLRFSLAGDMDLWRRFFRHAQLYTFEISLGTYRSHAQQRSQLFMAAYYREAESAIREEFDLMRRGQFTQMLPPVSVLKLEELCDVIWDMNLGQKNALALFS
jgi:glycosyltransferase involved in cell wall biosynthesis